MHVRCIHPEVDQPLHEHSGADYGLADIPDLFRLGRVVPDAGERERVRLTAAEIRELKVMADAYSFDFEPGLIELCGEIHRFAVDRREDAFEFLQEE